MYQPFPPSSQSCETRTVCGTELKALPKVIGFPHPVIEAMESVLRTASKTVPSIRL